jgi:hypothetical protein
MHNFDQGGVAELGEELTFQLEECQLVTSRSLGPIVLVRVSSCRLHQIRQASFHAFLPLHSSSLVSSSLFLAAGV